MPCLGFGKRKESALSSEKGKKTELNKIALKILRFPGPHKQKNATSLREGADRGGRGGGKGSAFRF